MNQNGKREFLLLGTAVLTAMFLSMYDKYGSLFPKTQKTAACKSIGETEDAFTSKVLEENRIAAKAAEAADIDSETATDAAANADSETAADTAADTDSETAADMAGETAAEADAASDETSVSPDIRVLICSDDYRSRYHDAVSISASVPFTICYGGVTETFQTGETLYLDAESPYFETGKIVLDLTEDGVFFLPELKRSQSNPSYEGTFFVEKREEGLLLVNILPLETYLCYVVPSEMPSNYPLEAQKAQAICARSYAYRQMANGRCAEFGADVDDSVSYQVYNNIGKTDASVRAVQETAGMLLQKDGQTADALYYSTSCGIRLEDDLSEEAVFCSFLDGRKEAYEAAEPWYRWHVSFSADVLTRMAETAYPGEIGCVENMTVLQRADNGCAEILLVSGSLGEVQIDGEYAIRKFLNPAETPVTLQDGNTAPDLGMLPSAFFYITAEYDREALTGFFLNGGGYGHGKGMSQNGAKYMALDGKTCKEILAYYYGDGVETVCVW